ncbi:MAG: LysR family transcriptional regulator [Rhizobiaceae bacterium]|nr:LysR family transcriptional regulator [Rhizobiaceae bacterium]
MKIRQMEAMRAVVRSGTTKEAAPHILLTQSAVSKLISQLEDELNVKLFSRQGGQMSLTPEGRMIFEDVDRVLNIVDELREKSRDTGALRAGKLRIGAMPALGHGLLPQTLSALRERYPNVTTVIEEQQGRTRIEEQVLSGYYDLGLVTLPVRSEKLTVTELGTVQAVCVLPPNHHLIKKSVIDVEDLAGEQVISVDPETLLRHKTDSVFGEARVRRKLSVQTQSTLLACQLVRSGIGVAIVHPLIAKSSMPAIEYRPFRPVIELKYAIISNESEASRMALAFTALAKEMLDELLSTDP